MNTLQAEAIDTLLPFVESMERHAGICRRSAYNLLNAGRVHAVKIGSRTLIRQSELVRFLGALPAYVAAA
jgi:hypothetical protein